MKIRIHRRFKITMNEAELSSVINSLETVLKYSDIKDPDTLNPLENLYKTLVNAEPWRGAQ